MLQLMKWLSLGHSLCCAFRQEPEASCGAHPPLSESGDVLLVLDDMTTLNCHALHLQHASSVFQTALSCAPAVEHELDSSQTCRSLTRLPLPGATRRQVLLLLHCLYQFERESWVEKLCIPEIIELAKLAHRYLCLRVLGLADKCLVKRCGVREASIKTGIVDSKAWLTVKDAPREHQLAQRLNLTRYEALVGLFMGRHAHAIDLGRVGPSAAAVLRGARLLIKP